MILGKVIGNVVCTAKCPDYQGYKLLLVQPVDQSGSPQGKSVLALDAVQAGIGDTVIVIDEGGSARVLLNTPDTYTIRTVIAGIVDRVDPSMEADLNTEFAQKVVEVPFDEE